MNTNDNRLKAHKLIDHIFQDLLPAHGMAQRPEQIQLSHRMLDAMQDGARAVLNAGGCATAAGQQALANLDRQMLALNASPGGAADLLAATLFLDRVETPYSKH